MQELGYGRGDRSSSAIPRHRLCHGGLDKINSKEEDGGTSLVCVGERRNVPEEASELAARHAPSLGYLSGHRPNASSLLW